MIPREHRRFGNALIARLTPNRRLEEPHMFGRNTGNRSSASTDASKDACLLGVNSLVGNSVYDAEGNLVGKLEEIVIDTRTGCVRHAVLAIGGILGIGRKRVAIPWNALKPDANYRRCVVDVTQMRLTAVRVSDDDPWLQRSGSTHANENHPRPARMLATRLM